MESVQQSLYSGVCTVESVYRVFISSLYIESLQCSLYSGVCLSNLYIESV